MKTNYPRISNEKMLRITRTQKPEIMNDGFSEDLSVGDAIKNGRLDTSRGTMVVSAVVLDGPHAGAYAGKGETAVFAMYNPAEQRPNGKSLWDDE
jgi:hypothetical protein